MSRETRATEIAIRNAYHSRYRLDLLKIRISMARRGLWLFAAGLILGAAIGMTVMQLTSLP